MSSDRPPATFTGKVPRTLSEAAEIPPPQAVQDLRLQPQNLAFGVSLQQPQTAEAAFIHRMGPEHIADSLKASTEIQLRNLTLQEKLLDQEDAANSREHERKLKELELRRQSEQGARLLTILGVLIISIFISIAAYRGQYEIALKVLVPIATAVAGFLAGRGVERRRHNNDD